VDDCKQRAPAAKHSRVKRGAHEEVVQRAARHSLGFPGGDGVDVRGNRCKVRRHHRAVALQVAFERQTLKPVFHLIGFRLWV
jgi:hypothetical protein